MLYSIMKGGGFQTTFKREPPKELLSRWIGGRGEEPALCTCSRVLPGSFKCFHLKSSPVPPGGWQRERPPPSLPPSSLKRKPPSRVEAERPLRQMSARQRRQAEVRQVISCSHPATGSTLLQGHLGRTFSGTAASGQVKTSVGHQLPFPGPVGAPRWGAILEDVCFSR